jgi:hypothetical protein
MSLLPICALLAHGSQGALVIVFDVAFPTYLNESQKALIKQALS